MGFTKITNADMSGKGAMSLPNKPTISADELKRKFDEPAKEVVTPKFNNLIDELEASTSATSLGATAPTGFTGSTVQAVLNSVGASASSASSQAHSHSNKAVIDKFSEDSSGNPLYDGNPIVSGGGEWGTITGDLSDQTDLANALSAKADSTDLATVATSGQYSDLSGTPSLATVATSGSYTDLSNTPTIPTVDQTYSSSSTNAQSGTAVASAVATKSAVSWSQTITTGQKIATITVDGTPTDVYAPTGGGGGGGGAVDSVNGQTGTVVLDVDDINDVAISSLADGDVFAYDGTATKWKNKTLSIPTVTDTYSGTSSDAMSGKAVKAALETLDGTVSGSPSAGKTLTAFSETDGKVSATFGNISITKSQVSDFPAIPDELADLTGDVAISSPTSGQILQHNGTKWANANLPQGGHTMIDNTTLINSMNAAITEGTSNDDVVSAYGVGTWSNCDDIQLLVAVSADDDGIGTWEDDDDWETSGVRTGWIQHASLHGILSDDDVLVEPVFKVPSGNNNAVSAYAMRVDDAITGSLGGVAIKFNAPITANGYAGIRIRHLRTNTIILTP